MKRAVGYIRCSTIEQISGTSLESQKAKIQKYAETHEWKLVQIHQDAGISGSDSNRPALKAMIQDAQAGRFDAVLYTKLDRIGRSMRDIANLFHEFQELKIDVISVEDNSLNMSGPLGKALVGIMAIFGEFERSLIRQRTDEGRKARWMNQEAMMGSLPFGYRKKEKDSAGPLIQIDEGEAVVYRKMVEWYLIERLSTRGISERLNKEGIPSPSTGKRKKKPAGTNWDHSAVLSILKNPAYKGESIMNRREYGLSKGDKRYFCKTGGIKPEAEWIRIPFPPLVDEGSWNQIQERRGAQKVKSKRIFHEYADHFLLDGLIYCGECGIGRIRKKVKEEVCGTTHLYYFCGRAWTSDLDKMKKCDLRAMDADLIDREVFGRIADILAEPTKYIDEWLKDIDAEELFRKIEALQKREQDLISSLKAGFDFIRRGKDAEMRKLYLAEQEKLEGQKADVSRELKAARDSLGLISGRKDRIDEFKRLFSRIKMKSALKDALWELPFPEKRRVVEAMLSPENGGRVKLSYIRPADFLDAEEMAGMTEEERIRPMKGKRLAVEIDCQIDPGKIGEIINSINKEGFFRGMGPDSIPGKIMLRIKMMVA